MQEKREFSAVYARGDQTVNRSLKRQIALRAVEAAGLRDRVKIMIGGAPITEAYCREIGADRYTSDAASAAEVAVELCRV